MDSAYARAFYTPQELDHAYGANVHLVGTPVSLSLLARLCMPETRQPQISALVASLYRELLLAVVNAEFPRVPRRIPTRMRAKSPRGVIDAELLDENVRVVCVDIARAGILPSQVCYDLCNTLFDPDGIRQDHLIVSRVTDADERVTGARISGGKIGGPIDGRRVLFPDPMGATGRSLITAIDHYKQNHGANPAGIWTLNLIVTPQFIRNLHAAHPEAHIYALRVDRGLSPEEVLRERPGARWNEENGLTETDYIVPGAGGLGEILNNSWV